MVIHGSVKPPVLTALRLLRGDTVYAFAVLAFIALPFLVLVARAA